MHIYGHRLWDMMHIYIWTQTVRH